jgi:Protein of unknown function (DUF2541)
MKIRSFAIAVLALTLTTSAFAAGSKLLGATLLTRQENDVDVLRFASCRNGIAQLKLHIRRADAEIEAIVVHFANGEISRLSLRQRFKKGAESRWVDLPGGDRCISKIKLVGDSEGSRRQAKVEIYAR